MLDARALPISLTWSGGGLSSSFHDAGNWTASDAPYQCVPVGGDDVYFSETSGSAENEAVIAFAAKLTANGSGNGSGITVVSETTRGCRRRVTRLFDLLNTVKPLFM